MKTGMTLFFQSPDFLLEAGEGAVGMPDREVFRREVDLAAMAEPLGFDSLWTIEHHFSGYTMMPDPLMFLAHMAGRTSTIELGSMVVVLPWHARPMRVAESVAMLDNLSGGRFIFGIGRGLGRVEFDGMGVPMSDSRTIFTESAEMILQGLERGYIEHHGQHFSQEKRYLRPPPLRSFRGRTYAAAVSPESMRIMARLGVGIMIIPQKPWDTVLAELEEYRSLYWEMNGEAAPPPIICCPVFVDEDAGRAKEIGQHYMGRYYHTVLKHYELAGTHFAETKGYEFYANTAQLVRKTGDDRAAQFYADLQVYGTPDQCVDRIAYLTESAGSEHFVCSFSYAGLEWSEVLRNLMLFNEKVQPRLQTLRSPLLDIATG